MPVQIGSKTSDPTDPTGWMSDCHRRIELFLRVLNSAADLHGRELTGDERRSLDAALRYFRESSPKHNADEEESLFPRLQSVPDPEVQSVMAGVARLEQEHRWAGPLHEQVEKLGRQWLLDGRLGPEEASAFSGSVAKLSGMYGSHIDFEDRVLFPLAARVLSAAQLHEVADEMAKRRNLSGRDPHEAAPFDAAGCSSSATADKRRYE